ncbi:MAG: hypothetical protein DWQ10_13350 [Calditrichaeota bacterium]|nr:MAG: hypothetical protein DWQ10_13350 [Calditrichota bacterium]
MLFDYLSLVRLHQWHKNISVFLVLFLNQNSITKENVWITFVAMLAFICASSFVYLMNDFFDRNFDRSHPVKRHRPLAAGRISPASASVLASSALTFSILLGWMVTPMSLMTIILYLLVNVIYSTFGKRIPFFDVILLATGFLLRILCGAYAIDALISFWFISIIVLFCFLFGFAKRFVELTSYNNPTKSRPVLAYYSKELLQIIIFLVGSLIVFVYTLYTFSDRCISIFATESLPYTIPFVFLGVWRFFYQVFRKGKGEDPASLLLQDKMLAGIIMLWALSFTVLIRWNEWRSMLNG